MKYMTGKTEAQSKAVACRRLAGAARATRPRAMRRGGSTLIEFAMVVPVLLALLMGIMEFGFLVKNNLLVANATREGARAAATGKTMEVIQQRVADFAAPMAVSPACSSSVTSGCGSLSMQFSSNGGAYGPLANNAANTANNANSGDLIRVVVRARHRPLTRFFFFLNNRDINVTVTMRRE
jgi:Flp pilus assembly protein TadG